MKIERSLHDTVLLKQPRMQLRWWFVVILLAGAVINYLDRANLSIANPMIAKEFHLSPVEMGFLLSAFLWPYAIANLPAGWMVDKFGPKKMFAWASGLWSAVTVFSAFATGFGFFYMMRMLLGIAESPFFASAIKVTERWFDKEERGLPTAMINTGLQVANAIAPPVLTAIMLWLSWKGMFLMIGLMGFIVMAIWIWAYRDPERYRQVATAQVDQQTATEKGTGNWFSLFQHPSTWFMMVGNFGIVFTVWVFLTWLPGYLVEDRHLSILNTGWVAAIPFLAGIFGVPIGGLISDYFIRRGVNVITSRKIPIVFGAVLAAVTVAPVPYIDSMTVSITLLAIGYFASQLPSGVIWALAADVAPENQIASLGAIQNFAGFLGASLAPIVTGWILQLTGSFHMVFLVGAALLLVGAISYGIFLRRPIQTNK